MEILSQAFLDSCRVDEGRILRGENMTRIETFVDAAFAFALTMLVISIDEIPNNTVALLESSKDIPAFLASAIIIGGIWLTHTEWSRVTGQQDRASVMLSLGLVMLVMVFVYPIKLLFMLTFFYVSDGYLSPTLGSLAGGGVRDLFIYFGIGIMSLALIIILLYLNTLHFRKELLLTDFEKHFCRSKIIFWCIVLLTAVSSCLIAYTVDQRSITWAFYVYYSLLVSYPILRFSYRHTPVQR